MKFLVISNLFPPAYIGGYEVGAGWVCEELRARGHQVLLWTSSIAIDGHGDKYQILPQVRLPAYDYLPAGPCVYGVDVLNGVLAEGYPESFAAVRGVIEDFVCAYPEQRRNRAEQITRFDPDAILVFNPACLLDPVFAELRAIPPLGAIPVAHIVSDDWPLKWRRSHPFIFLRDHWQSSKHEGRRTADEVSGLLGRLGDLCDQSGLFAFSEAPDCDRFAYTSRFIRKKCAPAFPSGRPETVIHWGLPGIRDYPSVPAAQFTREDPLRLVYCGQIRAHKGLIRVLQALQHTRKPHSLTVIGDTSSEYAAFCEAYVHETGLGARVRFTGRRPPSEVIPLMVQEAEVLLLPSLATDTGGFEEPFSIVLIQGMAAGLCVAAGRSGGSVEAIREGETGLFFDPNDPQSIASLIDRLEEDRALARSLACAGRDHALVSYGIETMVDQLLELVAAPVAPAVFFCVRNAIVDPANSGCVRVARRLGAAIEKSRSVRFVTWDGDTGELHLLRADQAEVLGRFNGPCSGVGYEPGCLVTGSPLVRHEHRGAWLILPEVMPADHLARILSNARTYGQKVAAVFHDAIPLLHPEFCNPEIRNNHGSYMELLARCDLVIPNSHFSAQCLKAYWQDHHITGCRVETVLLPGEFPTARLGADSLPSAGDPIRILCVSTLEPRKNHARLLEAFRLLKTLVPNQRIELHLVGNSYEGALDIAERIEAAASADPALKWWRVVDDATLSRLYLQSHFTVYPSVIEGFGLPIVESLWHARPCICSKEGVMAEVAAAGGCITADVLDPRSIAHAMARLVVDLDLRRQLATEAASRTLSSWADYSASVLALVDHWDSHAGGRVDTLPAASGSGPVSASSSRVTNCH